MPQDPLIGKKVIAVRSLTAKEQEEYLGEYFGPMPCIEVEGGFLIYALCDEEGNGPGALNYAINGMNILLTGMKA